MTERRDLVKFLRSKVKRKSPLKCGKCDHIARSTTLLMHHMSVEHKGDK